MQRDQFGNRQTTMLDDVDAFGNRKNPHDVRDENWGLAASQGGSQWDRLFSVLGARGAQMPQARGAGMRTIADDPDSSFNTNAITNPALAGLRRAAGKR
jgi:hypothetical protein